MIFEDVPSSRAGYTPLLAKYAALEQKQRQHLARAGTGGCGAGWVPFGDACYQQIELKPELAYGRLGACSASDAAIMMGALQTADAASKDSDAAAALMSGVMGTGETCIKCMAETLKADLDAGRLTGVYACMGQQQPERYEMPDGYPPRLLPTASFSQAEDACAKLSAHVVSIHSAEENDFVRELWGGFRLRSYNGGLGYAAPLGYDSLNDAQFIGMRKGQDSDWAWSDGSAAADYSNWHPGAPNNPQGDAAVAVMTQEGSWDDFGGEFGARFVVCKRQMQVSTAAPIRSQQPVAISTAAPISPLPLAPTAYPAGLQSKPQRMSTSPAIVGIPMVVAIAATCLLLGLV
jgi:hypothetical protein